MSIHFSEFLTDINSSIYSIPIFNTILSSVVYSAIILSILVIIMLLFVYPTGEIPAWVLTKMFIYLVLVNTVVFSAHYSLMNNKLNEKLTANSNSEFMSNINKKNGGYDKDNIKVVPCFKQRENIPDDEEEVQKITSELTVNDVLSSVEKTL